MPICQNCDHEWNWKQTFKKVSFTIGNRMTCPNCGGKQYVTLRTRKITSTITFMITFISITLTMLNNHNHFFGPPFVFVWIPIGCIPLILGLYPFLVKISNEEEPFW